MRELERRILTVPVEWRAAADGAGPGVLYGYAAKYDTLSQNLGGFVETIRPGAFDKSIADGVRVLCRYNHDDNYLLGATESGTLTLTLDDVGLLYEVTLPDTSAGRDVATLAARGDVRYSSFAFYCIDDDWGYTEQGFPLRALIALQLVDVAPVNSPAYLDTTVATRAFDERNPTVSQPKAPAARAANDEADANVITQALGQFAAIDNIVDDAQASLAAYLGVPNPDDDDDATGEPAGMAPRSDVDDSEQRDTHSAAVRLARLRMELDEQK